MGSAQALLTALSASIGVPTIEEIKPEDIVAEEDLVSTIERWKLAHGIAARSPITGVPMTVGRGGWGSKHAWVPYI